MATLLLNAVKRIKYSKICCLFTTLLQDMLFLGKKLLQLYTNLCIVTSVNQEIP